MKDQVKDYYGETLQSSSDLKTNACCTPFSYSDQLKKALSKIHDEVLSKYYGCGLTIPKVLKGLNVLDLGSGSGRDCYLMSQLVGESGKVVGVDMTRAQLAVANAHLEYHRKAFGYQQSNVEFLEGEIECLDQLELEDNSLDLIISNCVINLSTDKQKVIGDCYRLLKQGGEMYFSDVYCNRRIPEVFKKDPVLYGECLSGALYWNDFLNMAKKSGFIDPRLVEYTPITIENKDIQSKLEGYEFFSVTYRLFKIDELEPNCEEHGQAVIYRGGIEDSGESFTLDAGHVFQKGNVHKVCGNTFRMLQQTRLGEFFEFIGDFENHYGIFPGCGVESPFQKSESVVEVRNSPNSCC